MEQLPIGVETSVSDCKMVTLQVIYRPEGELSVIEHLPFEIKRVYTIYGVPEKSSRGYHAHKTLQQLVVAAKGRFRLTLKDGKHQRDIWMNNPSYGMLIAPGIWRELDEFSSGAVCMVLASQEYDANDYIRDYDNFLSFKIDGNSSNG